jgi:hypothetical protein
VSQFVRIADDVEGDNLVALDLERRRLDPVLRVHDEAGQSVDRRALELIPPQETAPGCNGGEEAQDVLLPLNRFEDRGSLSVVLRSARRQPRLAPRRTQESETRDDKTPSRPGLTGRESGSL